MVGAVLGALRPLLALVIVGGAATAAVAPAFDMAAQQRAASQALSPAVAPVRHDSKPDGDKLLRLCLETRDPDSRECLEAALASDLSFEAFRAKVVALLDPASVSAPDATRPPQPTRTPEPTATPEPATKPEPTAAPVKKPVAQNDFEIFFKKCIDSRDLRSDPCESAYQLSGMSSDDFDAKVQAKIDAAVQSEFALWFQKCLDTRDLGSDRCVRARELSGLSADEFRAKFDAKVAPKDGGDFSAWFDRCLNTRDVRSDACFRAQQLIGFNDADFKAKFERYLADRDAKLGKPTPQPAGVDKPGTAVTFESLLAMCGQTHERASNACIAAQAVSGLSPQAFWAKAEAKFGTFH